VSAGRVPHWRTTAEVVLAAVDGLLFAREHDPATGYDELVVRDRDDL
jgi:predicted DNA-binding protein with PD1-like motif